MGKKTKEKSFSVLEMQVEFKESLEDCTGTMCKVKNGVTQGEPTEKELSGTQIRNSHCILI